MTVGIGRRRRIFKSNRRVPLIAVAAILIAGGVTIASRPIEHFLTFAVPKHIQARVSEPMGAWLHAEPGEVAVLDGDTLRLDNTVVRLAGVTEPDSSNEAAHLLAALVRDRPVACRLQGAHQGDRPAAWCDAGDRDLSLAVVEAGWARAATDDLKSAEARARASRSGLWAKATY